MKDQIVKINEALRLNKSIGYKGKFVIAVYMPTLDFKTGQIKIRFTDLIESEVDIMELEII